MLVSKLSLSRLQATTILGAALALQTMPVFALPVPQQPNTTPGSTNIAAPIGGGLRAGEVTYSTNSFNNSALITQNSKRAVIDWTSFDTAANEIVQDNFTQANSIQLNRISGPATTFRGKLLSPNGTGVQGGSIYLVNNQGFLLDGAIINVNGGVILSTRGISNAEGDGFYTAPLVGGNLPLNFDQAGAVNATVRVRNSHIASGLNGNGKYTILQGQRVSVDTGSFIETRGGGIAMGAGGSFQVTVDPVGDGLISYAVTSPVVAANMVDAIHISNNSRVDSSGTVGGNIILSANVVDSIYSNLIQVSGGAGVTTLDTHGTSGKAGTITVKAVAGGDSTITGNAVLFDGSAGTDNGRVNVVTNSVSNNGGTVQIDADVNDNTVALNPLVNFNRQVTVNSTSLLGVANDGVINVNARRKGVFDNTAVVLDAVNIFNVPAYQENTLSGPRLVQNALTTTAGSAMRPCAIVNGSISCFLPTPAPTPTPAPFALTFQQTFFEPLDRPLLSLRDDEVLNQQFTYVDPFFINRGSLNLSILGSNPTPPTQLGNLAPAAGGNTPAAPTGNLGDLAPAAGGNAGSPEQLASLEPAAGGNAAGTSCVNNLLDNGWTKPAGQQQNCNQQVLPTYVTSR